MIGGGARDEADRHRPRGRGRRAERAEAVEDAGRRHDLALGALGHFVGGGGGAGEADHAAEHLDEAAGQRQIGPARVGGDVEQHDHSLAALGGGDQRRAVGERRPGALGEAGFRLGQHLARDVDVLRHRHVAERAFLREGGERLRLVPAQAAAERAAAAAKLHRHEIVVGAGEAGAGETHQHAAVLDPGDEPVARLARDVADIGQHDHRHVLLDEAPHRIGGRRDVGEPHVGERVERARQIIGRGEQRLRGVGGRAGDDADGAAAPALVEQLHGAGRALAGDLQPRDVVADLDRQVDLGVGLALVVLEGEARLAERQALEVERADDAVLGAAGRWRAAPSPSARPRRCRRRRAHARSAARR